MSMFTLAISRLTTSNLPWFMDLTFQVPVQYEACGILIPQPRLGKWNLKPWTPREAPAYVLLHSVASDLLWPHGLQPTRLLCPWDSPGKNTGVGCHALLLGIFLTQGLNSALFLLLCHTGSLPPVPSGKPREAPSLPLIRCLPLSYLSTTSYQYSSQINLHSVFASGSFQGQADFKNASVRVQITGPGSSDK